jgi:hypothetical protein
MLTDEVADADTNKDLMPPVHLPPLGRRTRASSRVNGMALLDGGSHVIALTPVTISAV